jgi:hypothetical protein
MAAGFGEQQRRQEFGEQETLCNPERVKTPMGRPRMEQPTSARAYRPN